MIDATVQDEQFVDAVHELWTSKVLIGISSGLSLVGACVMIVHFLVFPESRKCGRRLLFCLHLADAGAACAWLLVFLLPTLEEDTKLVHAQTATICVAQGYLLVLFQLASCFWTACFAFHLLQLWTRRSKSPELYEDRYHFVGWGIPIVTVVHLYVQYWAGTDLIGESGRPWCWIRSWSDTQWSEQGFYVQLVIFYIPVVLIFLHNLATYATMYLTVSTPLYVQLAATIWSCITSMSLFPKTTDSLSTTMETRIRYRLLLYTGAFFLSNVWIVSAFIYQTIAPNHGLDTSLLYLVSFFSPLQGAMNAVAYGMNRKFQDRVAGRQATSAERYKAP